MAPKRFKKKGKAEDPKLATRKGREATLEPRLKEKTKAPCHNLQPLADSSNVQDAAARAWLWRSMPQRDVERVLDELRLDGQEEAEAVKNFRGLFGAYMSVQCGICLTQLMGALVERPERATPVLPADFAALEQIASIVQTAANASELKDSSSSIEFSPRSVAELAVGAEKHGVAPQPVDHTSIAKTVGLRLDDLTGLRERAVKLCAVDSHLHAPAAEACASADAAVHEWLVQITLTLQAASSTASTAFLAGSANECTQLDEALCSLWAEYQQAIDKLHLSNAHYREQQLQSKQAAAAVRAAMLKVMTSHSEALVTLHDEVQRVLSGESVAQLLLRAEPLRPQWETPLLSPENFSACDELHSQLLLQQVRQCSLASAPVALADWTDSVIALAGKDCALSDGITQLDDAVTSCRSGVAAYANKYWQPYQYPKTEAEREAFQRWQTTYAKQNGELLLQFLKLKVARQTQMQKLKAGCFKACADLDIAESRCQQGAGSSNCSGLADQQESVLLLRGEVLRSQEDTVRLTAQSSSSLIGVLSQRYWLTRQLCASLRAHGAVAMLYMERLCGDRAAAERRFEVIQACCTLEMVDMACKEWPAKQCERQLLEELLLAETGGTSTAQQQQQQQQQQQRKGKGKQQGSRSENWRAQGALANMVILTPFGDDDPDTDDTAAAGEAENSGAIALRTAAEHESSAGTAVVCCNTTDDAVAAPAAVMSASGTATLTAAAAAAAAVASIDVVDDSSTVDASRAPSSGSDIQQDVAALSLQQQASTLSAVEPAAAAAAAEVAAAEVAAAGMQQQSALDSDECISDTEDAMPSLMLYTSVSGTNIPAAAASAAVVGAHAEQQRAEFASTQHLESVQQQQQQQPRGSASTAAAAAAAAAVVPHSTVDEIAVSSNAVWLWR
jgi:hypothetical protein